MEEEGIKHTVLVMSGKGGVGKSTVTGLLAAAALRRGLRVGVLDVDLCGPSLPRLFGLEGRSIHQSAEGWVPVYSDASGRLGVVSLGFLVEGRDEPVIWRGPKKTASVQSLLGGVRWGALDLLLVDTPPGTSDEHISIVEALQAAASGSSPPRLRLDGALLVTTPQQASLSDVEKELSFCAKMGLPRLGLLENMSGYRCPSCSDCSYIFASGGGASLAARHSLPLVGPLPIDPRLSALADAGALLTWAPDASSPDPDPTFLALDGFLSTLFP